MKNDLLLKSLLKMQFVVGIVAFGIFFLCLVYFNSQVFARTLVDFMEPVSPTTSIIKILMMGYMCLLALFAHVAAKKELQQNRVECLIGTLN